MRTRILFLDDSGKPDATHASLAVVIAGFAVDADVYPVLSRRILGAKKAFFANRGVPAAWEIKSTAVIKPNPWKRAKNRNFCAEVARLLKTIGATCYSVTLDKKKMHHPMSLATSMPLQLQALVEHFDAECKAMDRMGMIVTDWSAHHHDQHASRCVATFVGSRGLQVHPGVYYASSHGTGWEFVTHPSTRAGDWLTIDSSSTTRSPQMRSKRPFRLPPPSDEIVRWTAVVSASSAVAALLIHLL